MNVRAKVQISGIELFRWPKGAGRVKFTGIHDSKTPENNSFTKATPQLELSMVVDNPEAVAVFHEAFLAEKCFYLDFSVAPE